MNEKLQQTPPSSESVRDKIGRLRIDVLKHMDVLEFNEKMMVFIEKIKKNYPDYKRYLCFHKLIGSSGTENMSNMIDKDFEGEFSVVTFLEGLLKTG